MQLIFLPDVFTNMILREAAELFGHMWYLQIDSNGNGIYKYNIKNKKVQNEIFYICKYFIASPQVPSHFTTIKMPEDTYGNVYSGTSFLFYNREFSFFYAYKKYTFNPEVGDIYMFITYTPEGTFINASIHICKNNEHKCIMIEDSHEYAIYQSLQIRNSCYDKLMILTNSELGILLN